MQYNLSNKELTNIKIYVTKRINSEDFWIKDNTLISSYEVNNISRIDLSHKYSQEYLHLKYPQLIDNKEFKHEFLRIIDMAIVKIYFVKYNIIILKNTVAPEILRQAFKGPDFYPYMSGIKYMINEKYEEKNHYENKATEKQLALLVKLLNTNTFLKFDYTKKYELTLSECSTIINYLTGKSEYLESDIVNKYFKNIYNGSVFNFIENGTIRESFKNSIYNFLLDSEVFFTDNILITQEECNELNRIDLACKYLETDSQLIKLFLNKNTRKEFIMDAALYIDRIIPKIYYILYCGAYKDEFVDISALVEFNHLDYPFTMNLDYKLSSFRTSNHKIDTKATVSQINYIYKLLDQNDLPLVLKNHRSITKKEASTIINMLKDNKLDMELKELYFDENKKKNK